MIRVAEAELREDIPFWSELLKLNFMKTFSSEQSCWSWTSWRHSLLSRVAEAELHEDIPYNSFTLNGIAEVELCYDITSRAELGKIVKRLPLIAWLLKWNFARNSLLSGVAEAELWHDITPRTELWKRNFLKMFPSIAELQNYVMAFPFE